jgi:sugar lactone lactonase YvrE
VNVEQIPAPEVSAAPVTEVFIERHAGRLIYNQKSKCWMSFDGRAWEYILDREVDRLLCEISADLSLVSLNKIRRDLGNSIWFAVPEMTKGGEINGDVMHSL